MALSILDGNQSATTLSTILSSGQHITAHTVVSLGTQAITDMRGAVSGSVVSISNFPASQIISGTVTANPTGTQTIAGTVTANAFVESGFNLGEEIAAGMTEAGGIPISGTVTIGSALPAGTNRIGVVTIGAGTVTIGAGTAQIGSVTASISGTVTANAGSGFPAVIYSGILQYIDAEGSIPVSIDPLPAGTNRIGVVTIGAGTVTLGAGTAQIGSVTASISGTVPISISSVTVGNSVTIGSLPALAAGTAQIGSVTASISNSVVTFYPLQGTTVTNSNFTSTTASTTLVSAVAGRDVLTVFNEGAGNLFISPGATATTISYQVRLSAGDYWECPEGQRSLAHTAVFATAGTARVTEVS